MAEVKKNMLRDRAKKLPPITDEQWQLVSAEYRGLVKEFIRAQSHSPKSKVQYESVLKQFGWYLHEFLSDKEFRKLNKRDFIGYLAYLRDDRKMSSSGQATRKAIISSLCNYVENIVAYDDEDYRNFKNFTRGLPAIPKNKVYEKVKITKEDYEFLMSKLEEKENFLGMAWLAIAFNCGARRSEIIQFKTEILDYKPEDGANYIMSHNVRLKGSGEDGKIEPYMIPLEALTHVRKWIETRGYEHEYIFTTKYNKQVNKMNSDWAKYFCSDILSEYLGRRVNPHLFKASCVTHLLEQGVPIELVSKFIAHHENVATTVAHYDLRSFEKERNNIFKS